MFLFGWCHHARFNCFNNWYIAVISHFLPRKIQSAFQWTTPWVIILLFMIQKNVFSQYFPDCCGLIPRSNFIFIGFLQEARPASYYFIFLTFSITMAHIKFTGSVSDRRVYSVQCESNTNNAQSRSQEFKIKCKMC